MYTYIGVCKRVHETTGNNSSASQSYVSSVLLPLLNCIWYTFITVS